jgi:hypothetical protein
LSLRQAVLRNAGSALVPFVASSGTAQRHGLRAVAARWNAEEDRTLRRLYAAGRPVRELAIALRRSPDAVTARRRQLGVAPRRARAWSAREDALLRAAPASGVGATRLAADLGRTPDAVRWRQRALDARLPRHRRYEPAEDEAIRRCFAHGGDVGAFAQSLGRSADAVRLRAQALGIHVPPRRARWRAGEDALVRDGYTEGKTCASIAEALPGRTPAAIAARAAKLGLSDYARRWSAADDARLARLIAAQHTHTEIARALVRTPEAVRRRCRRLGLPTPAPSPSPRRSRPWTEREDQVLRLHAGLNPAILAQLLGRSDYVVTARLRALGLRSARERSPHHPASHAGRATPGQRAAIRRAGAPLRGLSLLALADRLELPPTAIRALAEHAEASHDSAPDLRRRAS